MTEQQIRNISIHGMRIPEHMIGATLRYFNDHVEPGSFLQAVLEDDFMGAWRCADDKNTAAMGAWAALLYEEAPLGSYGSPENVKAWLAMRQDEGSAIPKEDG